MFLAFFLSSRNSTEPEWDLVDIAHYLSPALAYRKYPIYDLYVNWRVVAHRIAVQIHLLTCTLIYIWWLLHLDLQMRWLRQTEIKEPVQKSQS